MQSKLSFLRKKNSNKLTDKYFEHEVEADTNRLYCIGPIKAKDPIITCPVYGTVMRGALLETAIGISLTDKPEYDVGEIDALLFKYPGHI